MIDNPRNRLPPGLPVAGPSVFLDHAFQGGEAEADLLEERGMVPDQDKLWMLAPQLPQPAVKHHSLRDGFIPHRIPSFNGHPPHGSALEKDDAVITRQLGFKTGAQG